MHAYKAIDSCELFVAIATPDNRDRTPSAFVMDEVGYASGRQKKVFIFARDDTTIPAVWQNTHFRTIFDGNDSGVLIRDVLQQLR
ncbi:nucleoside 2-deoxyribosyltransferase [Candidatus Entotheonella palauensis]|uniref:nucleoside 2-deoxyribosyltransferase n=1 Tax=Candidatus Entotheonella palauensis TaxID=93172 RepID=UPI001C4DE2A9|nr:nucleoside 2-deoxyribosyltransferase [Candidatus Entotheonella palauensis]